jgi:hypothetical protein
MKVCTGIYKLKEVHAWAQIGDNSDPDVRGTCRWLWTQYGHSCLLGTCCSPPHWLVAIEIHGYLSNNDAVRGHVCCFRVETLLHSQGQPPYLVRGPCSCYQCCRIHLYVYTACGSVHRIDHCYAMTKGMSPEVLSSPITRSRGGAPFEVL